VAAGLSDRFALLSSARRTEVAQHRTLRAALDWSYQLLSKEEQRLLRHLAVFPAGFTFEAVRAVDGMDRAEQSMIELLSSLVSKSLCERVDTTSPTRWRLLETIRAYGLEKLNEGGEYPSAVRHHAEYFRDLISPIAVSSKAWLSSDDVALCAREIDNVRAALDWAFSSAGATEVGVRLTVAFSPIWQNLVADGRMSRSGRTHACNSTACRRFGPSGGMAHVDCLRPFAGNDLGADRTHARCRQEGNRRCCGRR